MPFLKSLQPATRLLQVHCSMVKARQQIGALNQAAALKRELEGLVFNVKALLQANGCREGFWMGNLKNKDLHGNETASQMAVMRPEAKGKGKRKAVEQEEPEEEEGGEEDVLADVDEGEEDDEVSVDVDVDAYADVGEEEEDDVDDGEDDEGEDGYPASMLGDDDGDSEY